jgi:4-methylaminobutanoate oxidase (formaldehyde-forming)
MTETADVVITGGGIAGLSVAWHLLRRQPRLRVVLLERQPAIATQATSQAAALLTRLRADRAVIPLVDRTFAAIDELGQVLGAPLPLHPAATLHAATTPAGVGTIARLATVAAAAGLAVARPGREAVAAGAPWLAGDRLADGLLVPDEGYIDPYLLADAYRRAARAAGAVVRTGTPVRRITVTGGRVQGVETDRGRISAGAVVIAAGAWANTLTLPVGLALAMAPVRSQYWITDPDPALFPAAGWVVILPDARAYARPEVGALLFGVREAEGFSADPRRLPDDLAGYAFPDDPGGWLALEAAAPALSRLVPALARLGIRRHVAGFSTYTPDGRALIGGSGAVAGLWVASGCCGAGIATSGGVGAGLAALILGAAADVDLAPFDPDRFGTVDPLDGAFRAACIASRAGKTAG